MFLINSEATSNQQSDQRDSKMVSVVKILPIFLHLLALTKKNCVSVPDGETVLANACKKLVESVSKFKVYLDPIKSILPNKTQMSELEDVTWLLPSTNETTQASKVLMKIFLDTIALQKGSLEGDEIKDSLFSTERIEFMKTMMKKNTVPEFGLFEQTEMQMADLLQNRQMRLEIKNLHQWSNIVWVALLLPQTVLLLFFATQFALLKLKERKVKKHTKKVYKERNLVQGLLREMRYQPAEMERPAPIELV